MEVSVLQIMELDCFKVVRGFLLDAFHYFYVLGHSSETF